MSLEHTKNQNERSSDCIELRPIQFASRVGFIVSLGLLAYASSFGGEFVFDDHSHIEQASNGFDWNDLTRERRPLLKASLALNYQFGARDPWGYHLFNVAVHIITAVLLFLVSFRTLNVCNGTESLSNLTRLNLTWVASLVWVVHPLNTQAVTYVVQRCESMSAMFAFLAFFALSRATSRNWSFLWLIVMIVSCWAGFASKQTAVAIPFILVVYDWCFCSKNFEDLVSRRGWCYFVLFLSLSWFASDLLPDQSRSPGTDPNEAASPEVVKTVSAGFSYRGATPLQYAATQPGVILYYGRLALWPDPLCIDYRWPLENNTTRIMLSSSLLLISLGCVFWGLSHRQWWAFWLMAAGLWLVPTSSVLPIADAMVEHRMYFPLACLTVVLTVTAWRFWSWASGNATRTLRNGLFSVGILGIVILLLGLTHLRNLEYHNPVRLWFGAIQVNPQNARAQIEVADYYLGANEYEKALLHFRQAQQSCGQRGEECLNAQFGLGLCHLLSGEPGTAELHFVKAVKLSELINIDAKRPERLLRFTQRLKEVDSQKREQAISDFFDSRPMDHADEPNSSSVEEF